MKYSIVLCFVIIAIVSCIADDSVASEKKTEKRGIYGGFGYGHAPLVAHHGYSGFGGYHGGYVGHGYYGGHSGHGLYGGYYPGYHGHGFGHHYY